MSGIQKLAKAIGDADIEHPKSPDARRSVAYYLGVGVDTFSHDPLGRDRVVERLLEAAARDALDAVSLGNSEDDKPA